MRTPQLKEWYKIHNLMNRFFRHERRFQIRKNLQANLEESGEFRRTPRIVS